MSECVHDYGAWYRWEYKSSGMDPHSFMWWSRIETRQARDCQKCGWSQCAPMETLEAKSSVGPISIHNATPAPSAPEPVEGEARR